MSAYNIVNIYNFRCKICFITHEQFRIKHNIEPLGQVNIKEYSEFLLSTT
jgi:hypothetical protein